MSPRCCTSLLLVTVGLLLLALRLRAHRAALPCCAHCSHQQPCPSHCVVGPGVAEGAHEMERAVPCCHLPPLQEPVAMTGFLPGWGIIFRNPCGWKVLHNSLPSPGTVDTEAVRYIVKLSKSPSERGGAFSAKYSVPHVRLSIVS